jgi:signal transduction histidine kinase
MKATAKNGAAISAETTVPAEEGSRAVDRERLVLPVLVILLISFLANSGLIFSGAIALNREAAAKETHLARTLLAVQMQGLENFARDHIRWEGKVGDPEGTRDHLDKVSLGRLADDLDLSSYWILASDGATLSGFIDGKPARRALFDYVPRTMELLIAALRANSEESADGTFLRIDDRVHFAVVGQSLAPEDAVAADGGTMVVATMAIDEDFLRQGDVNYALDSLDVTFEQTPKGFLGIPILGIEGTVAHLVWRDGRPGDDLLKPISPVLGATLLAIAFFLFRFMKGADLFLERQAFLASSLKQERKLRNLKSRFVSMVSHELRTPLATIRSATELLQQYGERMTDKEREEEHKAIHRSVDILLKLVDEVLVIGKSDWLEDRAPASPIDFEPLCREVWEETARALNAGHELELNIAEALGELYANEEALRTLLSNLFQNAIKYSRGGDKVVVEVTRDAEAWKVRVTDFGIGIPADEINSIFQPFHRAKNVGSLNGTGLGLSVAKATVKSIGGDLTVESQTGVGTTFEISLPCLKEGKGRDDNKAGQRRTG